MSYFTCSFILTCLIKFFFFFKQKTAYEMRISDWSSDVCSSDLISPPDRQDRQAGRSRRMVDDAADGERGQPAVAERAQLPGRDPPGAVLRPQGRSGGELRIDRRRHRA